MYVNVKFTYTPNISCLYYLIGLLSSRVVHSQQCQKWVQHRLLNECPGRREIHRRKSEIWKANNITVTGSFNRSQMDVLRGIIGLILFFTRIISIAYPRAEGVAAGCGWQDGQSLLRHSITTFDIKRDYRQDAARK